MHYGGNGGSAQYDDNPAILIFADLPAGQHRAAAAVQAAGCRVAAMLPARDAQARLDAQVDMAGLILELDAEEPYLDGLLDQVETLAQDRRCRSVIAMPFAMIDAVAARIRHGDVQLLCAPDPVERAAAIALITAEHRTRLNDVTTESETRRLHQLSEEVSRIARTLASLSAEALDGRDGRVSDRDPEYRAEEPHDIQSNLSAATIRNTIRLRRLRDRYFEGGLFADPVWDMLLDLMAARIERMEVAVSSLCIAAAVPPTTALRWIRVMADSGLLTRRADPTDGRRVFIELSDSAHIGMARYFAAASQIGGLPV